MDREHMQEVINGMRKIVKPYLSKQLKKINFEGCGNTDKAEFETDFEIVLTLAEQALAIPSAEPCEDAISRQAVLDYIYNDLGLGDEENGKDVERQIELERSYKYVKSLPPVKPQPEMGHWIEGKYKDTCDKCRCTYPKNIGIKNYCPNCGIKMQAESEDKE